MSNPVNLQQLCEKLNDLLINKVSEDNYDYTQYFIYHEDVNVKWIEYCGVKLIDTENYNTDLYDDEPEDFSDELKSTMETGEQKGLRVIALELDRLKTSINLANKIVSEEIYFKS